MFFRRNFLFFSQRDGSHCRCGGQHFAFWCVLGRILKDVQRKSVKKSRSWETWCTIYFCGLKEVSRDPCRQKIFFVRKPHEKDFRSSSQAHGQKNSDFFPKGSMNQKMWRSQKVKPVEQNFFCCETGLPKGFSYAVLRNSCPFHQISFLKAASCFF